MKILFLHLSDLHLNTVGDIDKTCVQQIGSALCPQSIGPIDKVVILVTGDIAYSGTRKQYRAFQRFKSLLIDSLKSKVLDSYFHFFTVPGNHDIDYCNIENFDRSDYEAIIDSGKDIAQKEQIDARMAYFNFSRNNHGHSSQQPFFKRSVVELDQFIIEVNLLNSSFFSLKTKNDQGLHMIPTASIASLAAPSGADMAIALMHHPHTWFNEKCAPELEKVLLEKNTIIFYGHEHYLAEKTIAYNGNAPAEVFCGGSLCNGPNWKNSEFFACVYDTTSQRLLRYGFKWDGKAGIYHKEIKRDKQFEAKPSTDIPNNINREYIAALTKDDQISSIGDLEHYYVFSGIQNALPIEDEGHTNIVTFEQFYKEFEEKQRFEISGGPLSGKSALLKMIFLHYLYKKCVLLCRVDDISSGNRRRIIKNLFENTYGDAPTDYEKFERLDRSQKIILIDDLHLINPKHVEDFLTGIEEEFGYIIYTTNNVMKLDIEDRIKAYINRDTYSYFHILPLLLWQINILRSA